MSDNDILVSIITPIYNEEQVLHEMAEKLSGHFDRIVGPERWEFILVDNGSRDNSPVICEAIKRKWPTTRILNLDVPDYGNALRQGLFACTAPFAHIINVDQWDIPYFEYAWSIRERYDLILGSKRADPTLNHQTPYRRFLSWGLNSALSFLFEYTGADSHGPKLLKMEKMRPILEATRLNRGQFDTEFTLRAYRKGLWIAEVPTVYEEIRPPRNWMITKIARNVVDLTRLRKIIGPVPYEGSVRFHRFSRQDVIDASHERIRPVEMAPGGRK